ncbi:MAG: ABC transporter permease [Methanolinea sp.]|nr:ABC transporter permease [Methanolinea sp.]
MNEILEGCTEAFRLIVTLDPEIVEITGRSLGISLAATAIAALVAVPAGGLLHFSEFRGKRGIVTVIQALYALPTVVVGLFVFLLLSRSGPFGFLGLLFTPAGMVVGQAILIVPVLLGMTVLALSGVKRSLSDEIRAMGATRLQATMTLLGEARYAIVGGVILGFGRAISEVGVAMIIGGNIRGYTRVLTTAIALETSAGNIALSIALGIILLWISLAVTLALSFFQERKG